MVKELDLEKYLKQFKDIKVGKLVPLIQYEQTLGLPDIYKIEEYTTQKRVKNKQMSITRFRLIGRLFKNCKKPETKKFYKGNLRRQGLSFIYKNKELWIILKSNWPSPIKDLSIKCTVKDNWLYFDSPKDYVGVWYKYGRGRINFIIIPKILELHKEFWEVFGILIGEKNKGRGIEISNTEPNVLNHLINYFKNIKFISEEDWKVNISINSKKIKKRDREMITNQAISYWKDKIPIKQLHKIYWYDQFSTTLGNNFGEIDLRYFNESTNKVINHILDFVKKNALKNKIFTISLLKGLLAAEGGTTSNKYNGLSSIGIASKDIEERKFYRNLLIKIGLKANLYKKQHNVRVCNISGYFLALKYNLFSLHPKREKIFLERLYNTPTIKAMCTLIKNPLLIKNIVKKLKLKDYRNLNKNFSKLTNLNYLTRRKTEEGFIYSVPYKYKNLLQPLITESGTNLTTLEAIPN